MYISYVFVIYKTSHFTALDAPKMHHTSNFEAQFEPPISKMISEFATTLLQ